MVEVSADLDAATECVNSDPERSLEICERYLSAHPDDSNGLFCRFQAFDELGEFESALADINRVVELDPKWITYFSRGSFLHNHGYYQEAVTDLTKARQFDVNGAGASAISWYRADSLARLGRLEEALSDCNLLSGDHWTPGQNGLPVGNKQEFIEEIKRRALQAQKRKP
jgi:tetratricopeptide (TPR) repeat protein